MGEVKQVIPLAADEAVFLVADTDTRATTDRDLATDLQRLLGRKVWIVQDSDSWKGKTASL